MQGTYFLIYLTFVLLQQPITVDDGGHVKAAALLIDCCGSRDRRMLYSLSAGGGGHVYLQSAGIGSCRARDHRVSADQVATDS